MIFLENEFSFVKHEDKADHHDAEDGNCEGQEIVECRDAVGLADDHHFEVLAVEGAVVEYVVKRSAVDSQPHLVAELGITLVVTTELQVIVY